MALQAHAVCGALFNHLALPSFLPESLEPIDHDVFSGRLFELASQACSRMGLALPNEPIVNNIGSALRKSQAIHSAGHINCQELVEAFARLAPGSFLILHVRQQNAGLLVQHMKHEILFEAFEASPPTDAVLAATRGPFLWDFPASAVAIPVATFFQPDFQISSAEYLSQSSDLSIKMFGGKAFKAGTTLFEDRQVAEPTLILETFMKILEVHGTRKDVKLTRKRFRDDVCWAPGSPSPWRRSPMLLVLRVCLQRVLAHVFPKESGRCVYKFLIAAMLVLFLEDGVTEDKLSLDQIRVLLDKICRRLTKLDSEVQACSPKLELVSEIRAKLEPYFHRVLGQAKNRLENLCTQFKRSTVRQINRLPPSALGDDQYLTLANCTPKLQAISQSRAHERLIQFSYTYTLPPQIATAASMALDQHRDLADRLEQSFAWSQGTPGGLENDHLGCINAAAAISEFVPQIMEMYLEDAELMSSAILLLMTLWMHMDKAACQAFPLLRDYPVVFRADMLSLLHLDQSQDLQRLAEVEKYLNDRSRTANTHLPSILGNPSKESFPVTYFQTQTDMIKLYNKIEYESLQRKPVKMKEWSRKTNQFNDLRRQIERLACSCGSRGKGACQRCRLAEKSKQVVICVHEHSLSKKDEQAHAAVFEARIPQAFEAYRDATWLIVRDLCLHNKEFEPPKYPAKVLLGKYKPFERYTSSSENSILTLASSKKPFPLTHYGRLHFPVEADSLMKDCAVHFRLYDQQAKIFLDEPQDRYSHLGFGHLINQQAILKDTVFAKLDFSPECTFESGPSSNEIIASHPDCPPNMGVNEFDAFKALQSGTSLLWPRLLTELVSSNLNFGSVSSVALLRRLSLQVGPPGDGDLRKKFWIFSEEDFCIRLLDLIQERVESTAPNARESLQMENLITLTLRVVEFSPIQTIQNRAIRQLAAIRSITISWMRLISEELRGTKDHKLYHRRSLSCLWAAILCRRTFASEMSCQSLFDYDSKSAEQFWEAALHLDHHLPSNFTETQRVLRQAIVRDAIMTTKLLPELTRLVEQLPKSIFNAINQVFPARGQRTFQSADFATDAKGGWIYSLAASNNARLRQHVHFNIISGKILFDGTPVDKLPEKHRSSEVLRCLFGDQNLLFYASDVPGLQWKLAFPVEGHEIHLGLRNDGLFIRAFFEGAELEYLDPGMFYTSNGYDLPGPLISNKVHWLDLDKQIIHIRKKFEPWKRRIGEWQVDVMARKCSRYGASVALDPGKRTFNLIASNFAGFESASHIIAYQKGPVLYVELDRLSLRFQVKRSGKLYCRSLRAVVEFNQDAGVFHGLRSMLVLENVGGGHELRQLQRERYVLVPLGTITHSCVEGHNEVLIDGNGTYALYTIDAVLGRLITPVERRLVYRKILLHALTTSAVPDELTGRRGIEEAVELLQSGICQPWEPINPVVREDLETLAGLSAKREFYPEEKKHLQMVHWRSDLSISCQDPAFAPLVDRLLQLSDDLERFQLEKLIKADGRPTTASNFLNVRQYYLHRELAHGWHPHGQEIDGDSKKHYETARAGQSARVAARVWEVVKSIHDRTLYKHPLTEFATLLTDMKDFGGFSKCLQPTLLHENLSSDFGKRWGALWNYCRNVELAQSEFTVSFCLGSMASNVEIGLDNLRLMLSFLLNSRLKAIEPPAQDEYRDFRIAFAPSASDVERVLAPTLALVGLDNAGENTEESLQDELEHLTMWLQSQWPREHLQFETLSTQGPLISLHEFRALIQPVWSVWQGSVQLDRLVEPIQAILSATSVSQALPFPISSNDYLEDFIDCRKASEIDSVASIMAQPLAISNARIQSIHSHVQLIQKAPLVRQEVRAGGAGTSSSVTELETIVDELAGSPSNIRRKYATDLLSSVCALKERSQTTDDLVLEDKPHAGRLLQTNSAVLKIYDEIRALLQTTRPFKWLIYGVCSRPSMTRMTLLECLGSKKRVSFGEPALKAMLLDFGVALTMLQRYLRIFKIMIQSEDHQKDLARQGAADRKENRVQQSDQNRLESELKNRGHSNWNVADHPDWLLLEIESNILIREEQVLVALETMSPMSGANSLVQLQMGAGKSSCIMAMIASELADGHRLFRVIVPKPLLRQTASTMQRSLGNLLQRFVRHVPYYRRTPTDQSTTQLFRSLHEQTQAAGGIQLVLPEHLMSFKLSAQQRLSEGALEQASKQLQTQKWMEKVSRDVIDESDFILSVKCQLIYPGGSQSLVDGHPQRWTLAQTVLEIARSHVHAVRARCHGSIEVYGGRDQRYPQVYFTRVEAEKMLLHLCVDDILDGQGALLPCDSLKSDQIATIKRYLLEGSVDSETAAATEQLFDKKPAAKNALFQLRGLFVHRVLIVALQKRFGVEYGLHPSRKAPIAVPYLAKGVPHDLAEFGHPDVAILLTCLSFYYQGVSQAQLRQAWVHLSKKDDPASEYIRWAEGTAAPQNFLSVNIDDDAHFEEVWLALRLKNRVINFFLNNLVFPVHAKQFQRKIQASAWDIPLMESAPLADTKTIHLLKTGKIPAMTTGYSGTNDSRLLLPLNIEQRDLPVLAHTNAEVLMFLLATRNRGYKQLAHPDGSRMSEVDFLRELGKLGIRVLIDAGATIMEMDNYNVAHNWLRADPQAEAAVYFGEDGRCMVYDRSKAAVLPLVASVYAENLENCLVYLDQAHCRGVDMKLPANARGALTLALGQTKDHTVQAAMRLRDLGRSQCVHFFAPPEVHQSILDLKKWRNQNNNQIDSRDVVRWLLEQTCDGIEDLQPLYHDQGMDFCHRTEVLKLNPNPVMDRNHFHRVKAVLEQSEKLSLQRLYSPLAASSKSARQEEWHNSVAPYAKLLDDIQQTFENTRSTAHLSSLKEVEQEREDEVEVENVRAVHLPGTYKPLPHHLRSGVRNFATSGKLVATCDDYLPAFVALESTRIGKRHALKPVAKASRLFVSQDFMQVIKPISKGPYDELLRPVNWLLWCPSLDTVLIVSPFEAERVLPQLQGDRSSPVHLVCYAAPVTRGMLRLNDLGMYAFPPFRTTPAAPEWLKRDLGLFSGRLYFPYAEYAGLVDYLGFGGEEGKLTVKPNSSSFLREWLSVRRRGHDILDTPMGFVSQNIPLEADDPFFRSDATLQPGAVGRVVSGMKQLKIGSKIKGVQAQNENLEEQDSDADEGELEYDSED